MLSPITRKTCHIVSLVAGVCALLFLFLGKYFNAAILACIFAWFIWLGKKIGSGKSLDSQVSNGKREF